MPDSIQVSEATAQILKDAGKKRWLERECSHERSENGSIAGSTSYRLSRRIKTSKSRRPDYDASCDARYEDFVIGHEFEDPSILALHTVELVTHLMRLMMAERAAAHRASAACLDDVQELIDESHPADPISNDPSRGGTYEIDDEVLKQVQTLIGHIDAMFVKDKLNPCIHALTVVEEFAFGSNSSQHVGCDESTLIGKVALVLAAFVHDVGESVGEEINGATNSTGYGKFSTLFWDLFMADRYETMRAFFFANAIEQSQFLVSIVSAVSAFERDPDAIPSVQTSDESLSTEHNYSDDDSMCEAVDAILSTLRKRSTRKSKRADSSKGANSDVSDQQQVNEGSEGHERPAQAVTLVDAIVDANSDDHEQKTPSTLEMPCSILDHENVSSLCETANGACETPTPGTLATAADSNPRPSVRPELAVRNSGPSFDPNFFV
jgi:hypothetical protein